MWIAMINALNRIVDSTIHKFTQFLFMKRSNRAVSHSHTLCHCLQRVPVKPMEQNYHLAE